MPCMCWYDPPESSKLFIKIHCEELVTMIKILEKDGDPLGCSLNNIHDLLDHLYDPTKCKKKNYD